MESTPRILAYTVTHGARRYLPRLIPDARGTAGVWFDWLLVLSGADEEQHAAAKKLLDKSKFGGVQFVTAFKENRGQHWATKFAFELARDRQYDWLLRIDDDIQFRTKRWLKKMIERLVHLKFAAGDQEYRLVATPVVKGLKNPIQALGIIQGLRGQDFPCEIIEKAGGACRLHNLRFFNTFEPNPYAPLGRRDPESVMEYVIQNGGMFVRFPDIRVYHPTVELERDETPSEKHSRKMGHYWPWIGPGDATGLEVIGTGEFPQEAAQ